MPVRASNSVPRIAARSWSQFGVPRGVGDAVGVAVGAIVGEGVAGALVAGIGDGEGSTVAVHATAALAPSAVSRRLRRTFPVVLVVELAPAERCHVRGRRGVHRLAEADA